MNDTFSLRRFKRLAESAIADFKLDLKKMNVLTEAASGAFACTPLIAAMAGCEHVVAVAKDSPYGTAKKVAKRLRGLAGELNISNRIKVTFDPPHKHAKNADLVTNTGFVRPLDADFISRMKTGSAITLMCEPWEVRHSDVDVGACERKGVPVLGTCETHKRLCTFRYVGMLALRLLMEAEIEVFRSNIILAGSGVFGDEIHRALKNNGAIVKRINPLHGWKKEMGVARDFAAKADCVVVCEHHARSLVLGGKTGLSLKSLAKNEVPVVHISGAMDYESMDRLNIRKIPEKRVAPGVMTVTTAYLGPKPVIDLHTAGLKVGEELVKGMRLTGDPEKAVGIALAHSPAMALRGGPPSNRRS